MLAIASHLADSRIGVFFGYCSQNMVLNNDFDMSCFNVNDLGIILQ